MSFARNIVRLQCAENTSACLSIGATLPENARAIVFTFGIGVLVLGVLGYLLFVRALPHHATIALSLIAGGGLSNMIDRIAYGGYVVDFLNIGFGGLRAGVFNIADVAITVGAICFIARNLKHERAVGL